MVVMTVARLVGFGLWMVGFGFYFVGWCCDFVCRLV